MPSAEESVKVFVGNLSFDSTEEKLSQLLSELDIHPSSLAIHKKRIFRKNADKKGGEVVMASKGYGFVTLPNEEVAQKTIEKLNGRELDGRPLTVQKALPPPEKPEKTETAAVSEDAGEGRGRGKTRSATKAKKKSSKSRSKSTASKKEEREPFEFLEADSLFVANFPFSARSKDFKAWLEEQGFNALQVHVPAVRRQGGRLRGRGFAFVKFESQQAQTKALEGLQGKTFRERELTLSIVSAKKEQPDATKGGEVVQE